MLYVIMKERVDHAKMRALMQGIVDKDKGPEVFEEYMKMAFPWIETAKGREKTDHMKKLLAEINRGPIGVTPLPGFNKQIKSRLKERIERAKAPVPVGPPRDLKKFHEQLNQPSAKTR